MVGAFWDDLNSGFEASDFHFSFVSLYLEASEEGQLDNLLRGGVSERVQGSACIRTSWQLTPHRSAREPVPGQALGLRAASFCPCAEASVPLVWDSPERALLSRCSTVSLSARAPGPWEGALPVPACHADVSSFFLPLLKCATGPRGLGAHL